MACTTDFIDFVCPQLEGVELLTCFVSMKFQ